MTEVVRVKLQCIAGMKDPNDLQQAGSLKTAVERAVEHVRQESDPFAWTNKHMVSKEQAARFASPEFAYDNLIIEGHLIAIVGQPGAGKTTIIIRKVVPSLVQQGYEVIYVNVDVAGVDAKEFVQIADEVGFDLLMPDVAGTDVQQVTDGLISLVQNRIDCSGKVLFLDTLKKFTEVISKSRAKEFYKLLRQLTALGMTVVVLGHTNKYSAADGKPVFEGTIDLLSDCDELIYLIPDKRPDGSLIVSTEPSKARGKIEPITFEIAPNRNVNRSDYVDVLDTKKKAIQFENDSDAIERITEALRNGKRSQSGIVESLKDHRINAKRTRAVLKRYAHLNAYRQLWREERAFQGNKLYYSLIEPEC